MFGDELVKAFREFKTIWDPDWKMNPGKIVRPYKITENLHFGARYRPGGQSQRGPDRRGPPLDLD